MPPDAHIPHQSGFKPPLCFLPTTWAAWTGFPVWLGPGCCGYFGDERQRQGFSLSVLQIKWENRKEALETPEGVSSGHTPHPAHGSDHEACPLLQRQTREREAGLQPSRNPPRPPPSARPEPAGSRRKPWPPPRPLRGQPSTPGTKSCLPSSPQHRLEDPRKGSPAPCPGSPEPLQRLGRTGARGSCMACVLLPPNCQTPETHPGNKHN